MSSVIINGDTSGSITLAAPAVSGTTTLTLPTTTDTLVGKTTTDTLTNKTLTSPTITGATITVASTAAPAFSAYPSSNQNISSSTWTKMTFDTEEFDTNSNFASSRFTPTVAGYYQINGAINSGNSATNTRTMIQIYKNGLGYKTGNDLNTTGSNGLVIVSSIVYFNGSTDYVEIYGYFTGTSPSLLASSSIAYFNGAMIRSA